MRRLNPLGWLLTTLPLPLLVVAFVTLPVRVAAEDAGNLYNTPFDVRAGESYFQRQCSRCHGFDATGNDETGAPDLTGTLSRASSPTGIFNIIREGIAGTAMLPVPLETPDSTVWQLVAYIDSLSSDPANIDLPGSVEGGQALYNRSDCADCHMIAGEGGRQGPDLTFIGEQLDPDEIKEALTEPSADVAPRWWQVRVVRNDGSVVEGLRMGEDTFGFRIMDADANLWTFQKNAVRDYEVSRESTMPGYAQTLTENEIDDLVAYLFSLREEN